MTKLEKTQQEKIESLERKLKNKDKWCQLIIDIGFDYDGYRKADSLMKLIDELVTYSQYARDDYDYEKWLEENDKKWQDGGKIEIKM